MKRHLSICAAVMAGLIWSAAGVSAQDIRIGFVDLMKFQAKSSRAQEQQKQLRQLYEQKVQALENKKKELIDLQEALQKQGPMLKEETRNAKIKEIGIKEMEFKLAEKEAQNSLQNDVRSAEEVFIQDIRKIIVQIRQEKKLTLVINSQALMAADDTLDVTDEVIKVYDAATGAASKPAAAAPPRKPAPPADPAKPKPR